MSRRPANVSVLEPIGDGSDPESSWTAICEEYDVQDERLRSLLAVNPDVGTLLEEAAGRIHQYFPADARLSIRLIEDPEDDTTGWYIFIETALPAADATRRLRRYDREWWINAKSRLVPDIVTMVEIV